MITIFKNIKETSAPFYRDIDFVFKRIKEGKYSDLIEQIRAEDDKTQRNELKKGLPAICFSGTFKKRADDAIMEHSGLICLDFDGYPTKNDMLADKSVMCKDKYVMAAFISPSGNGLKVIVKIPAEPENHKRYFDALQEHFNSPYFDVTSKNISRVCYESADPDICINMDSVQWTELSEVNDSPISKVDAAYTIPLRDENVIADRLLRWWNKKYGFIEGSRNANIFILAAAFNEFGIHKSYCLAIMGQFQSSTFPFSEIQTTVDSAYKDVSKFGTKFYEDEAELHRIRKKINNGASSKEIKKDLRNLHIDEASIDDVYENIEENASLDKFWAIGQKGGVTIVHFQFKEFLEQNGFYKFAPHGSDKYMFVRVTNNLIDKASEEEIKDFTLNHLMQFDDLSIYNHFADKTRYFKEDFLSMIDTVNIHFVEDTKDQSFIYFSNCALKVTKDKAEPIDYVDLGGYVWRDQVIDRDWVEVEDTDCDFKQFISNISGDDPYRISSLKSTIGFLMNGYKDPGFCPSVILNDEVISDNPEGGTGKGLFTQGVAAMKKIAYIDGKTFSFDKAFAYQTVTTDTQVMCFDDVGPTFGFERLFSVITEGLTIEKKNKDAIKIPFKYSPKIVITTNYAIRGEGNSFERRKWELEFKQYYTKNFTPVNEFGKRFFDEWDAHEWCTFDNYMIENLKLYLEKGLIESEQTNLQIRKLSSKTCHAFIEWCGLVEGNKGSILLKLNKKMFKDDLYNDFIADNPDYAPKAKHTISRTKFYKWLNSYGNYLADYDVIDGRDGNGRWIEYRHKDLEKEEHEEELIF